jgi:hypothetical protein
MCNKGNPLGIPKSHKKIRNEKIGGLKITLLISLSLMIGDH